VILYFLKLPKSFELFPQKYSSLPISVLCLGSFPVLLHPFALHPLFVLAAVAAPVLFLFLLHFALHLAAQHRPFVSGLQLPGPLGFFLDFRLAVDFQNLYFLYSADLYSPDPAFLDLFDLSSDPDSDLGFAFLALAFSFLGAHNYISLYHL